MLENGNNGDWYKKLADDCNFKFLDSRWETGMSQTTKIWYARWMFYDNLLVKNNSSVSKQS